ncbi:hypothetical protein FHS15_003595 [Paenibacillus castaneae]|uniref:copper amine oxidase N-terminal domain-containing protein n=1 Tax=Paenibacillus castaneae TaxID=474957 RepID=UPI000C9B0251|nr:copper amine oxidase N-terminal domain-containing protein [Paenibacillus castaneae]NIK78457.1 hypothetical protein [Paenibacillus castaneae]
MLRRFGTKGKLAALLMVFILVFVTGCQSVSNLDFNTVLHNALKVKSSESKQSIEMNLEWDETAAQGASQEETALIKLLSNMKLQLDNVKMQDSDHLSLDGNLIFGDASGISFNLKISKEIAVLVLDGAKQPFVLDLTSEALLGLNGLGGEVQAAEPVKKLDEASMTALGQQLIDIVGAYAINNLPNPERISVSPSVESINGVNTSLLGVHMDLNGPEIWTLLKKYVDALAADRAGLNKMVAGVLDLVTKNQEIWAAAGIENPFEFDGAESPASEELVKEAADGIAAMLTELQSELKQMEEEDQDYLNEIFSKQLNIKADVFIDNKLDIRKQVYVLTYKPKADSELGEIPIKSLSLKIENESWNVNGVVKADAPVAAKNAIPVDQLFEMQGYQILKKFDEKSTVYDLLKNKLHINKQTLMWYSDDDYNPPIVTAGGITIIPLRDTAEQLGAKLTYDAKTKNLTIFDEATNNTITLKIGTDAARINSNNVKWSFPVVVIDGAAYAPARDLAKALKATIKWTDIYDDVKLFTFEREA